MCHCSTNNALVHPRRVLLFFRSVNEHSFIWQTSFVCTVAVVLLCRCNWYNEPVSALCTRAVLSKMSVNIIPAKVSHLKGLNSQGNGINQTAALICIRPVTACESKTRVEGHKICLIFMQSTCPWNPLLQEQDPSALFPENNAWRSHFDVEKFIKWQQLSLDAVRVSCRRLNTCCGCDLVAWHPFVNVLSFTICGTRYFVGMAPSFIDQNRLRSLLCLPPSSLLRALKSSCPLPPPPLFFSTARKINQDCESIVYSPVVTLSLHVAPTTSFTLINQSRWSPAEDRAGSRIWQAARCKQQRAASEHTSINKSVLFICEPWRLILYNSMYPHCLHCDWCF